jgi:hypothetical protein
MPAAGAIGIPYLALDGMGDNLFSFFTLNIPFEFLSLVFRASGGFV